MLRDSKAQPMQTKIIKDLWKYVPQMVIPALIAFISVPVYTRLFDPSAYGNFNIVRITINLLDRTSSWIGCSLTRYYNEYDQENKLSFIMTTILKINFFLGVIITIIAFIVLALIGITHELKLLFEIGFILFTLQMIYTTLSNVLRMQRRINVLSVFIVISTLLSFSISIVLIMVFDMKIESIMLASLIVTLLFLPLLWRMTINKLFQLHLKIDYKMVKKFATYGIPLTISSLGIWILDLSDRYIIKLMLNSYEVGVYSACYNVVWNSLFLVVNLFFMVEEPLAMKIFASEGKGALGEFIQCETRLYLIVVVPLTTLVCCYSKQLLSLMVASKYIEGSNIAPYVAISVIVIGIIYKYHLGIQAMEQTKYLMYIVLVSGAFNVVLNVLLVPHLGILGAGIATIVSYALYLLLIILTTRKIFRWAFPFTCLCKVSASSVLAVYGVDLFITTSNVLLQVAIAVCSGIIYIMLLWLFKEISQEEIDRTKSYMKNLSKRAYAVFCG